MFTRSTACRFDSPQCVEVDGLDTDRVKVRSSVTYRQVSFTREEWAAFIEGVKAGEFDLRPEVADDTRHVKTMLSVPNPASGDVHVVTWRAVE